MRVPTLFLLSVFLFGCDKVSDTADKNEKLKDCLVDQAVSSIVDPKNLMLYAATVDLMTRALFLQKAAVVSDCRSIIMGARNGIDLLSALADTYCPKEMANLSTEQLIKLDEKATEMIGIYSNLSGSIAAKALGRCAEL